MPNTHETLGSLFTDIANSIRTKKGESAETKYVADNFPSAIDSIVTDPSGDATATASDILAPKTAYSQGSKITGTIPTKTQSDLTVSGATVSVPSGYYASNVSKSVDSGSATTPAENIISNPTITWDSINKVISSSQTGSKSITPSITAGYVAAGTAGTVSTSGSASVTAESLDINLIASNVKDGVTIFNTTGTFSSASTIVGSGKSAASAADILTGKSAFLDGAQIDGTMANNGATGTTISTQGGTYTIPAGYTSGGTVTAQLPVTALDNTIISGSAYEEATGDYAWKSIVTIPVGYHSAQTIEKTFSTIFPAPTTEGTADKMLLGYQLYDHDGKLITGTMANNGTITGTISTQGGTFTIPAGYAAGGTITATIGSGVVNAPVATKGTVSNNSITVTPSVSNTAGYIAAGSQNGTAVTVSASELVSGTYTATAGTSAVTGIDVTNYASLTVNPTPSESKTATANGTVTPSSGKLLSSVVVAIPVYNGSVS